ncbi:AtpZ/AtpI family protein [Luteibaculum oceani]|uniref:AtpZ/AtpI family protein n=1 Tax=Luteibaculum oceani TaxID=1294296 RepID=A0A5C6VIP9_9FLAO|nr:AtpZ/AtpI family protein [Luteibaculum oceani]
MLRLKTYFRILAATQNPSLQEPNKEKEDKRKLQAKFATYTGSAFKVVGAILLFFYFGRWLDEKFGFEKPWLAMTGSLVGVAAGIYSLIKDLNR